MNRLKWLKEQIAERQETIKTKRSELSNLAKSLENERRTRTAEEVTKWEALESEIEAVEGEVRSLEAEVVSLGKIASEDQKREALKVDASVGASKMESKEARNQELAKVIIGVSTRNSEIIKSASQNLIEGGHYGEQRSFNSIVDSKGGILLPTSVASEIIEIEKEFGFIPRFARSYGNILSGDLKVPNSLSKLSFTGVSEGGTITGTSVNLGGIQLKAHKWAGVTSWTNEIGDQAGAQLVSLLLRQIAEGLANVKDTTFLKGNGTSTYNNIKGLETLAGTAGAPYVRLATAAAGNTSYATLDPEDYLNAINEVAPGARKSGMYVFHPNMEVFLRQLKDGNGRFVYAMPNDATRNAPTLWGYPVFYTEAANFATGTHAVYGYFVNPSYIAYADGRTLSIQELREATVKNENGDDVNLAMTDSSALRFTAMFDIKPNSATVLDGANAKGGFVVLRTNNA